MRTRRFESPRVSRRHHNNKGYRQIRRGKTRMDAKRFRRKYIRIRPLTWDDQ